MRGVYGYGVEYCMSLTCCISPDVGRCNVDTDTCNHRIYVTTTRDFETFSRAELFFDPGGVALQHGSRSLTRS